MTSDTPNVFQRMQTACSIIDGQKWVKDLSNAQYKSIPVDAMRAGVRKACVQAGLVHTGPDDLEIERERTADGRTTRFYATCTFHYINVDDPSQIISFFSAGEAMDNGDKGTGKAITNLIKNHYKAAFDIGEQDENDSESDDIDAYSNEEYYGKVAKAKAKEDKAAKDKQAKSMMDTLTDWAFGPSASVEVAGIVGRYCTAHGIMDGWDADTLKACFDECSKARGSQ